MAVICYSAVGIYKRLKCDRDPELYCRQLGKCNELGRQRFRGGAKPLEAKTNPHVYCCSFLRNEAALKTKDRIYSKPIPIGLQCFQKFGNLSHFSVAKPDNLYH